MKVPVFALCVVPAVVALSVSTLALAQTETAQVAEGASRYAAEPVVIERADTVVSMASDGTGWAERTFAARIGSDAALKKVGVLTVAYAGAMQRVEIEYARVRHADGTVVETPVSDAMDMPAGVTRAAPFYSDLKEVQLPIRNLRVGDTLEYEYRVVRTKAEAPGEFWGQQILAETAVTLEESLELRVPAGKYVQVWSPTLKPAESTGTADGGGAQKIYRWTRSQLEPTVGKEAEAAAAAKKKVLWTADQELDAERGKLPTVAWTTFKSWAEVGAWYGALESDRIVPDETIRGKAAELTAGKTTEEAKAQALYSYVALQIRYIGVAFGIGRYQPHTAAEILSNQYGDCKDKHTLLAALLSAEGIRSSAVLIGAGVRFNEAVPSPASFNHVITRAMIGGKPVWLDSTAEVAPWSMLVLPTRDKEALLVPTGAGETAEVVRTPTKPSFADVMTINAVGSLDANGVSTSHVVMTFRGDTELAVRTLFRQVPPDKYDQVVQLFSKGVGFAGVTSSPEISPPGDTAQPFKLEYDYKREKAGDWDHLRTLPQVIPAGFPQVTEIEPPVRAIQLGFPRIITSTSSMKLPDGWSAILPPALHVRCAYASYDMTYRLEAGTLYADRRIEVIEKKVPVSEWKAYRVFVDAVNPGKERYVQLVGPLRSQAMPSGAPPAILPEQWTEQIAEARKSSDPRVKNELAYALAGKNERLSDAQALAEDAVKMQEQITAKVVSMEGKVESFNQMGILGADWETLGWVYYRERQLKQAETYMHAAWELKPRNIDINVYMGFIYEAELRPEEAATFYRMALSGTNSPKLQGSIHALLSRVGAASTASLPMDAAMSLPTLDLQLNTADTEPEVDILLTRGEPAAVSLLRGNAGLEKPLTAAIQTVLADALPDAGPEKLLRRARVSCSHGDASGCTLHFVGSEVAMQASPLPQERAGH